MSRIIVIEDDLAILRGLRDNLEYESYEVYTATDGEQLGPMARHPVQELREQPLARSDRLAILDTAIEPTGKQARLEVDGDMRRHEVSRNRNRHGNRGADRDHSAHEQQRFA